MKNQNKTSAVVTAIIIVAVLAIVGGGIWYYTSNKPVGCQNLWWYDNEHTTCQQPKQFCDTYMYQGLETFGSKADCEQNIAKKDEFKNWKTYRNEKYGFEVRYPKSIAFISEKEEKFEDNMRISLQIDGGEEWQNRPFPLLIVLIWTEETYNELLNDPYSYSFTQLKAGVSKAIEKNGKVYELSFGFQDGPTQWIQFVYSDDYKKLLSTFKFIEPNETADWKTYTSTELGLSFKYPSNFYLDDSKKWGNDILISEEKITFPEIGGTSAPLFIGPLDEQVLKDEIANLMDKVEKDIEVDNKNATRIEGRATKPPIYKERKGGKLILTVIEVSPDKKIRFRGYEQPIDRTIGFNLEEVYNQILSTFRFIE